MNRIDAILARGRSDAVALHDRGRSLTYAAMDAQVSAVAGALQQRLAQGDRVALWLPKSLEAVVLTFAIARAGAVAVPVNPVLRSRQLGHILEDSGARLLVTHGARAAGLASLPCPMMTLEEDWAAMAASAPYAGEAPGGNALAALLYTSGSTGRPKGVMVTHANLLAGARSVAGYLGTAPDDRVLSVLPLSFDLGFSQLTTAFHAGASVVLLDYLTARDVVQAAARHRITQLAAVPPLWVQLAALEWPPAAIASMRTLSNSGGRLPAPTVRALRLMFPAARLHLMYGLTEAFRSTTLPPALVDAHPDSIGRAIPDAEILVVRPDGSLTADGEPGELVHCGPLVTMGYWQDPVRTAERFRPAPPASKLGGTAVWSGDTVVRDAQGLLRFIGRADETIKTMGTRVSPTEIEELAYQSGVVEQAVALGVADETAGQRIRLVVSAVDGVAEAAAEQALRGHMKREAAAYMQPASIIWMDHLPTSANGKLDRAAIRERFGA
ncbi:MAG: acyl-CoA ligase (AMP-forming), exosortase A system-associated [Sandarakinorhabdus sp.]|nr:acyl-CoA ligase (AMP-forming), exosortase A system-associated [Sandarakinorhabdus sp.]